MFIWDLVSITFGWLVFLFLLLFIIAFVKQVIKEVKEIKNNLTASKSRRFSYALNMALKGSTIGQVRSPNKSGATGDGEHLKSLA